MKTLHLLIVAVAFALSACTSTTKPSTNPPAKATSVTGNGKTVVKTISIPKATGEALDLDETDGEKFDSIPGTGYYQDGDHYYHMVMRTEKTGKKTVVLIRTYEP